MSQQRIALHLTKANAAAKLATLDGLPRHWVHWARGSHLDSHLAELNSMLSQQEVASSHA